MRLYSVGVISFIPAARRKASWLPERQLPVPARPSTVPAFVGGSSVVAL
jgi:hypothetical protein